MCQIHHENIPFYIQGLKHNEYFAIKLEVCGNKHLLKTKFEKNCNLLLRQEAKRNL